MYQSVILWDLYKIQSFNVDYAWIFYVWYYDNDKTIMLMITKENIKSVYNGNMCVCVIQYSQVCIHYYEYCIFVIHPVCYMYIYHTAVS